jgi:hypothetical protein
MSSSRSIARAAAGLLAAAALLGVARDVAACSVLLPDQPESVRCDGSALDAGMPTAAPALALEVEAVEVRRSRYAPPGYGDCGELGSVAVRFRLAGGASWPSDVGLLISHVSGEFPWFQPPMASTSAGTGWVLLPVNGSVSFLGPDDPRQPLNVHLVARVLDCQGATSAPIDVVITDPGRPEQLPGNTLEPANDAPEPMSNTPEPVSADAGVAELRSSPDGCAMPLAPRGPGAWLAPSLVLLGITRRCRRRST